MRVRCLIVGLLLLGCQQSAPERSKPSFEPPVLTANEPQESTPAAETTPEPTSSFKTRPLPVPEPTATTPPPKKKKKVHRPSFIPKTDYPTYEPELLSQNSGESEVLGVPGRALDQNEARPVYHPPVIFNQMVDRPSLDVQFQVAPDGSCTAILLTSTGDSYFDQQAVRTLNTWRWRARQEGGRPVASTENVRLRRTR